MCNNINAKYNLQQLVYQVETKFPITEKSITFIKKDGSVRQMYFEIDENYFGKYMDNQYLCLLDTKINEYRNVNMETVQDITFHYENEKGIQRVWGITNSNDFLKMLRQKKVDIFRDMTNYQFEQRFSVVENLFKSYLFHTFKNCSKKVS